MACYIFYVIKCCFWRYINILLSMVFGRPAMAEKSVKRKDYEANDDDSNDEWVGPLPSEASQPKKRKS